MRWITGLVTLTATFGLAALPPQGAASLNRPGVVTQSPAGVVDAGWIALDMPDTGRRTDPFAFTTTAPVVLSFTDEACPGDRMRAIDGEAGVGATSPLVIRPRCRIVKRAERALFDKRFSSKFVMLSTGDHSISFETVFTFTGGFAAAFRVDTCTVTEQESGVLTGTEANDVVCGGPANDTIRGEGGRDLLLGGGGSDVLTAGAGRAGLAGGRGADVLNAGDGPTRLLGGPGGDILRGGPGVDSLIGEGGADVLQARAGNDALVGGPGPDVLLGGPDRDICLGGPQADLDRGCEVTSRR